MYAPADKEDLEFLKKALNADFGGPMHHRAHLRLGWLLLRLEGESRALLVFKSIVVEYAEKLGIPNPYDFDKTTAWLGKIARCIVEDDLKGAPAYSFEEFMVRFGDRLKSEREKVKP